MGKVRISYGKTKDILWENKGYLMGKVRISYGKTKDILWENKGYLMEKQSKCRSVFRSVKIFIIISFKFLCDWFFNLTGLVLMNKERWAH